MKTDRYLCPYCKKSVESSTKPKRSFIGFLKIQCTSCQKQFRYPLTAGYVVFYWILLAGNVAWMLYVLSQSGKFVPNPIGIVVLIFVVISLVKSRALKREIEELKESVSDQ